MMPRTCKAAVVTSKGEVVCHKMPVPSLKDNEVLVKVHASLISPGTEMNMVRSRRENPTQTGVEIGFGYSTAGEIVAVKGDCKGLKPGMRVACMGGGAKHASYNCVPVNLVVPISDKLSYEEAAFASLAATALQAVHRTEPLLGEYGIVLGQGIVGNLAAQLCQDPFMGVTVIQTCHSQEMQYTENRGFPDGGRRPGLQEVRRPIWSRFRHHGLRRQCRQGVRRCPQVNESVSGWTSDWADYRGRRMSLPL